MSDIARAFAAKIRLNIMILIFSALCLPILSSDVLSSETVHPDLSWVVVLGHFETTGNEPDDPSEKFKPRCMGSLLNTSLLVTSFLCLDKLKRYVHENIHPVYGISLPDLVMARSVDSIRSASIELNLEQSSSSFNSVIATIPLTTPKRLPHIPKIILNNPDGKEYRTISVMSSVMNNAMNKAGHHNEAGFTARKISIFSSVTNCLQAVSGLEMRNGAAVTCLDSDRYTAFMSDLGAPLYRTDSNGRFYLTGLVYSVVDAVRNQGPLPLIGFRSHIGFLCQSLHQNSEKTQNGNSRNEALCDQFMPNGF